MKIVIFLVLIFSVNIFAQTSTETKTTASNKEEKSTSVGTGSGSETNEASHGQQKQEFAKGPWKNINEKWEYNYLPTEEEKNQEANQ